MIDYIHMKNEGKQKILFMHGLGGNVDQWHEQLRHFSVNYEVLAISLSGHGKSDPGVYDIKSFIQDIKQVINKLKYDNFIWVGNSMGGVLAFESLNEFNIKSIITNGTTPKLRYGKFTLKLIEMVDRFLIKKGYSKYIKFAANNSTKKKSIKDNLYKMMIQTDPEAVVKMHQLLGDYDYLESLNNSKIKIYIIKTPGDSAINKELKKYLSSITNDNVYVMKSEVGGHIFNMEYPKLYNEIIEKILKDDI